MSKKKNSILIIEDSETMMAALVRILESDYKLYLAKNGEEGIKSANAHTPDLILADIVMPNMDGFEVIRTLHESKKTRKTPIIFITGLSDPRDEEKGLLLGASDYIRKPFDDVIVRLRVGTQMRMLEYVRTIEKISVTDLLTNIPNRRSFSEKLEVEWARATREHYPTSLLMIDIDDFKRYNDTYGHLQGDKALQAVSLILSKVFKRKSDFYARWGGEEFAVICSNTDVSSVMKLAEITRMEVEKTIIPLETGEPTRVTVSIGVNTQIPKKGSSSQDFIHYADNAMYTSKKEGKNRVSVSPTSMVT